MHELSDFFYSDTLETWTNIIITCFYTNSLINFLNLGHATNRNCYNKRNIIKNSLYETSKQKILLQKDLDLHNIFSPWIQLHLPIQHGSVSLRQFKVSLSFPMSLSYAFQICSISVEWISSCQLISGLNKFFLLVYLSQNLCVAISICLFFLFLTHFNTFTFNKYMCVCVYTNLKH